MEPNKLNPRLPKRSDTFTSFKEGLIADVDPLQSYLSAPSSGLSDIFQPRSIAVIGATERIGSVGRTTLQNLINSNEGKFEVYPVNPGRETVLGLKAYKTINEIANHVDLAIIITPAHRVPEAVTSCGTQGCRAVVVISAGFKELGEDGQKLEDEVVAIARKFKIRLVGPNCLGVMQPNHGMNATFASCQALKGNIAFASQSGAMCTAVLDWSMKENIGFSSFISIGSMADVNWGDIIDYLGNDPLTESILIYMETIGDASSFFSAAKGVCTHKPIIVIKAGKSDAAAKAAASHTGSLAGSYDAFLAAMSRVGVMVVDTIGELFNCALALGKTPRPQGPNLLIVTNAGGPGVLATDAVEIGGGKLAELPTSMKEKLDTILPAAWSHGNPIDVLGDASADLYAQTLELCIEDDAFNGVLVILSPQSVTEPTKTAREVVSVVDSIKQRHKGHLPKPILASWMGGNDVAEGFKILNRGGVPAYSHPDAAARTFATIWQNTYNQQMMSQTPSCMTSQHVSDQARAKINFMLNEAVKEGRTLLTEAESKCAMALFGIPIAETIVCKTPEAAVAAAVRVKFPCVVKLNSETITHKSDVGGVKLDLKSEEEIRKAFTDIKINVDKIGPQHFQGVTVQPMLDTRSGIELLLGSFTDRQLGPLIVFGSGGCMVEIYKDTAMGIPPLNMTLATRQIEQTRVYEALKGGHGLRFPGVPLEELQKCLVAFSQMVAELVDKVAEIDINPVLALPDRIIALDARICLRSKEEPLPGLAIRPYPDNYVLPKVGLKDGTFVKFRPSHHNDFKRFIQFHKDLSKQTIRQRYLAEISLDERLAHTKVQQVCAADYSRFIGLLAVDVEESELDMYAIARITRFATRHDVAELKIAVADSMQGKGLGTQLLAHCVDVARQEKLSELRAVVLSENTGFIKVMEKFPEFEMTPSELHTNLIICKLTFSSDQAP